MRGESRREDLPVWAAPFIQQSPVILTASSFQNVDDSVRFLSFCGKKTPPHENKVKPHCPRTENGITVRGVEVCRSQRG